MIHRWGKYLGFLLCCVIGSVLGVFLCGQGFWPLQQTVDPQAFVSSPEPAVQQELIRPAPVRPLVTTYTVKEGDNLSDIARKCGIDTETLRGGNPELVNDVIHPGQQLNILAEKGILHTVKPEQTIWSIARQYGADWQKILADNPGLDVDALHPGEKLFVRGGKLHNETEVSRGNNELIFGWPATGTISSVFGYRWGSLHTGIDIAADTGETIRAARSGRVTFAGWLGGYGLTVIVNHGRGWETLYGHASSLYVSEGEVVQRGQSLAAVGSTGNSTGPHLHFEVRKQGVPLNPMQFLP